MKKSWLRTLRFLSVFFVLCLSCGILVSCNDDDDDSNRGLPVAENDPTFGYVRNSTVYTIAIDFGKDNEFSIKLAPDGIHAFNMDKGRSHLLHVVVLDKGNHAVSEFFTNFNVDYTALDNEWRGFVCSWYVDIVRESGFGVETGD